MYEQNFFFILAHESVTSTETSGMLRNIPEMTETSGMLRNIPETSGMYGCQNT